VGGCDFFTFRGNKIELLLEDPLLEDPRMMLLAACFPGPFAAAP
jgi:hypothetical protein